MEPNVEIMHASNSVDRNGEPNPVPVFGNWIENEEIYPCDTLKPVFNMVMLEERKPLDICEILYSICNSYPDEMFAPEHYRQAVTDYRAGRNRSLSVGDVIRLNGNYYVVDNCGFKMISPEIVNRRRVAA